jgi:hypothetical protein
VAIASDASRLYGDMTTGILFPSVYRNDKMVEGYLTLYQLSEGSWDHVVPGHDSLEMALYPAPGKELAGIVVRLDVPPRPLS